MIPSDFRAACKWSSNLMAATQGQVCAENFWECGISPRSLLSFPKTCTGTSSCTHGSLVPIPATSTN